MKRLKQRFVDADVFVSLANKADTNHGWAITVSEALVKKDIPLVTSGYAFGEAVTVISQQLGRNIAMGSAEAIVRSISIIDPDEEVRLCALDLFGAQTSKNVRFTDCVNMILMKDLDIKEIFSQDKHYKKNGFLRIGVDIAPGELKG